MNRLVPCIVALAVGFACEGLAYGGGHDPAAAEALFQQARADAVAGDYEHACARFDESFRLEPTVGTLINLGDCAEHLGHVAAALAHFTDALAQLPNGDDRVAYVKDRIARVAPRVPRLQLEAASPEPMTLFRDRIEIGAAALNLPLPVEPGPHVIVVRARGHRDRELRVSLVEGEELHVRAEPGEPLPVAATPEPSYSAPLSPTIEPSRSRGAWPWLAGSVGVAGIGVGTVAGILALGDASTVRDHCPTHTCSGGEFATASNAAHQGEVVALVSTVGFGVGIAGALTAAYLWLRPATHGSTGHIGDRHTTSVRAMTDGWVAPWAVPNGAGLTAGASFE